VIADVGNGVEGHARGLGQLPDDGELVVDALHVVHAELLGASPDDRIRLGGDDQVADAHLVEAAQAEPVAACEGEHLLPGLVHPDAVVREDAVEVEHGEPHPLEQRQQIGHRRAAACAPACSGRGSTSSKVRKSSDATGRRSRLPTSPSSSEGGKPPSAGDLIATSSAVRTWPRSRSRAATSFFPIFSSGFCSTGSGRLTPSPSATGTRCRSRTSRRSPSGISEKAWSVPFHAWSSVKCFSITRAPSMYATSAIEMPFWWSESPMTKSG